MPEQNEYSQDNLSNSGAATAATDAWNTARGRAGEALQTGERYVREHPGTSVLSIFGLGFFFGLLVGLAAAHEERTDYSRDARKLARRLREKLNID